MTVETKYLGKVNIEEKKIIHFTSGLPGFINEEKFALLDMPGTNLFQTLQSIKTPHLAFIVTNPYYFYKDYEFTLDDQILEILHINNEKDVLVLSIVTLKKPFADSTINLKAPIIINSTNMHGKQYILNIEDYHTKVSMVPSHSSRAKGD